MTDFIILILSALGILLLGIATIHVLQYIRERRQVNESLARFDAMVSREMARTAEIEKTLFQPRIEE